ncbi:hypothetical protein PDIG_85520 [Penicillium digitatum PHI26]|uniref:Uncharacterized protein n=2 Tax=Penicillium digitatum TaxID=36651 RepID=K9F6L8_PEND2|nr:hypothetical protein PDIP_47530 [Penicillium digitatum Pd1]EKV04985.1 hypothetical protein PDIG_85520 [Penicillium digitatum PHI26]EKV13631.1 hypothetical protein PDIP_47530 [Penicillium digitatum Pd1]
MDHERVIRDLFPALVVQLDRETSSTPSSESDDSAAVTHESPTPRVANTLRSSVAPRMGQLPQFRALLLDRLESDLLQLEEILRSFYLHQVTVFLLVIPLVLLP